MGSYIVYLLGIIVMLIIYWYFASKVKIHSNYVAVYAVLIGFIVYMSQKFNLLAWLVVYLNKKYSWDLPPIKATSDLTMFGFGLFLIAIVWMYYNSKKNKESHSEDSSQKNTFKSLFNFGSVEQKNEKR